MEQSIIEKFKRVKWSDILHIFKFILAIPFALLLKLYRKDIWLLCDSPNEASDNAYWLYKYIRENHSDVDIYFAIDKNAKDYKKVAKLGKVVHYGSFMHWVYYLAAERNVSSQKSGKPNAAICYVLEVYGLIRNKRAFLQHGITMSDVSYLYYKNTKIKLFVTCTHDEHAYVSKTFGYPNGYVKKLGFCRFDGLHQFEVKERQLLIMPTWRMYIRNELNAKNDSRYLEAFKETEYFKAWNGLLNDEQFIRFIEMYNISVLFYPHREMRQFLEAFDLKNKHIKILTHNEKDIQTLLKESAYLITDYSSVSMDFAYMKKPLTYFQFDYEKFRESHIGEGYFSYKRDGFGPVCESISAVVESLQQSLNEECIFTNKQEYLQKHKEFFDLHDTENCHRNYEAIAQM